MLSRKISRILMKLRSKNGPRKTQNFSSTNDKLQTDAICFECRKPGHLKVDYLGLK